MAGHQKEVKRVTATDRAAIEKQLRENGEAIEKATKQSRRIHEVLKESQRVRRNAIPS
jgi:hypothetical protein